MTKPYEGSLQSYDVIIDHDVMVSMRHNGALEQRFQIYAFRMAITSKEASADFALKDTLIQLYTEEMAELLKQFPLKKGATILSRLPSYERWAVDILIHSDYDDYWKQHRGYAISEYYENHADVPTLYLGGWYDSYARNTCESDTALSKKKKSRQHLLMGPWTHGQYEITHAGDIDFGTESSINYQDLKLAWFDHYLKDMRTEVADWSPVRIFTMGTGDGKRVLRGAPGDVSDFPGRIHHGGYWRSEQDWPLPKTRFVSYYFSGDGTLSNEQPIDLDIQPSRYTFDPKYPVPTIGGGISAVDSFMRPGAFDQRGRLDFMGCKDTLPLNCRNDV